jgi:uncharacterized protein YdaU (DUF1376 family)
MNFYPFHIGDYISHTSHLTNEEDLAYRRLIDLYYQTEQPFTRNLTWLAKRVKSTEEVIATVLVEFFEETEEGWKNKRADEEIAKYKAMQEGGRKGAAMRWGKGSDNPPKHSPMPTKNQEPITKNHSIGAKAPKAKRLDVDILPTEWLEFCKTTRADLEPTAVFDQFKDYWIAQGGQKGAKLDWFATWRNWVRNQKSIAGSAISKELPLNTDQQIARAYEVECGGDPTKARFNSYYDMKKFVLDFRDKQKKVIA